MKTIKFLSKSIKLIIAVAIVAALTAQAQTITTNASGGTTVISNPIDGGVWTEPFIRVYNDLRNATNIAVVPFGVALVSGDKKGTFGGGLLGLYNVNNYVGIGVGTYWLGEWYEFNGTVQLQYPLQLWGKVVITPFVVGGVGTSFSGAGTANGDTVVVSQAGLNVDLFSLGKGWTLGGGGFYGNITGAREYSGNDAGGFMKISRGF